VGPVDLVKKRNTRFLAKYQKLISGTIFPNQDLYKEVRELKEYLRVKTGCFFIVVIDGIEHKKTISPSFDNVTDDIEFDRDYYAPTIRAAMLIMNGTTEEEIRAQDDEILGFA
jgi:hypothetical protein